MPTPAIRAARWWSLFDPRATHGRLYLLLLALRTYSALHGHGYIHPDEWMQSGEPYFGLTLPGIDAQLPWEWRPDHALRSLSALRTQYLAVDVLLGAARRLGPLSGRALFWVQRGNMLLWTLLLDVCVARVLPPQTARYVHYLFGVSTAATTFLVRPFSNTHEAHLIAFGLLHTLSFYSDRTWHTRPGAGWHYGILLAMLAVDGVFTRFTFAFFALPLATAFLHRLATIAAQGHRRPALVLLIITTLALAVCAGSSVHAETGFYTRSAKANGMEVASAWGTRWVVPPLNALRYNAKTANVAQHGLHPRWLHAMVNLPMMVGAANCVVVAMCAWQYVWGAAEAVPSQKDTSEGGSEGDEAEKDAIQQVEDDTPSTSATSSAPHTSPPNLDLPNIDLEPLTTALCLATIALPLLALSLSPHQEPRFLLALCFPSTLLFALHLQSRPLLTRPALRRTLLALHATQHLVQLLVFSHLHHAALLPALFHIDTSLSRLPTRGNALFERYEHHLLYRTFPVPLHLIPHKGRGMFPRVQHYTSTATPHDVVRSASIACDDTWIYAPAWIAPQLSDEAQRQGRVQVVRVASFAGHVDMDHLRESCAVARVDGWRDAFALHKLEVRCLSSTHPEPPPPQPTPAAHHDL
ncbi:related to SMP3-alpha 1,2-mannosyltransferase involved in glycosyl phosphatidyl inositol biosynthesis [Sporisorium reilianum f. sp. reilianum]|uniref:Mannosyltransferase n=1 Tax=Sporisorium reilianum f. sp. reilianum TaxID=72559 RepID=A0A2N8UIB0_9BASI|nr:related to SMP3-alpha 1,2-mannosyltransferase involved in glycosyl phosphatidyl inositol biosynthesis [Sporisorium reilianum f. sp. reilianum]